MAMVYTQGALFDSSTYPVEKTSSTTTQTEVPETLLRKTGTNSEIKSATLPEVVPEGSQAFKIGSDTVIVSGSVELNGKYNLLSNQMPDAEWLQLHVVDNSLTSMEDDSARAEQFLASFYIERNTPDLCYLNFCTLPVVKGITTSAHVWQYRGSATYGDAGHDSEFPHVYSTIVGRYIVYLHSKEYLPDASEPGLKNFFNTITFTIQ